MKSLLIASAFWGEVIQADLNAHKQIKNKQRYNIERIKNRKKRAKISRDFKFKKSAKKRLVNLKRKKKTTLIFAPHPDDEILCCANFIREKIEKNEQVKIVYLTNGDALSNKNARLSKMYGIIRQKESEKAMNILGVKKSNLLFLNFPDGNLDKLVDDKILISAYTKQEKSNKYAYFPFIDYTKNNLKQNLTRILNLYPNAEIIIPSAKKDTHPDHAVTGELVLNLANKTGHTKIFEYVIHENAISKKQKELSETRKYKKLNLIRIFKSQFHTKAHKDFLEKFASFSEKFTAVKKKY
jgi:LmbE family N-acetylglucosaminyl deacetylase